MTEQLDFGWNSKIFHRGGVDFKWDGPDPEQQWPIYWWITQEIVGCQILVNLSMNELVVSLTTAVVQEVSDCNIVWQINYVQYVNSNTIRIKVMPYFKTFFLVPYFGTNFVKDCVFIFRANLAFLTKVDKLIIAIKPLFNHHSYPFLLWDLGESSVNSVTADDWSFHVLATWRKRYVQWQVISVNFWGQPKFETFIP